MSIREAKRGADKTKEVTTRGQTQTSSLTLTKAHLGPTSVGAIISLELTNNKTQIPHTSTTNKRCPEGQSRVR